MKFYPAMQHNLVNTLYDVKYPISKKALIAQVGNRKVQTGFDTHTELKDLFAKLPLDEFSCAAELFNNITCAIW